MPLYDYICVRCLGSTKQELRTIDERRQGPKCNYCHKPMQLLVSPVRGIVKNPAVPKPSK